MPAVRLAVRSGPTGGPVLGIAGLEFDINSDSTSHLLVIFCGRTLDLNLALLHSVSCKKMAELFLL